MKSSILNWKVLACLVAALAITAPISAQHRVTTANPALSSHFISFDPPGSTGTIPASINDAGAITGFYMDRRGTHRSFVRAADGTFTTFAAPASINTYAQGINRAGVVVGWYSTDSV